jgi:hypothetical protein
MILNNYLFIQHDYKTNNCVTLLTDFYKKELSINIDLPEYPKSKRWLVQFTTDSADVWADKYAIKVPLTDARNYDLMVFKASNSKCLTHFGLYLERGKFLHMEEASYSKIELLDDYWLSNLYTVLRHEQMV